MQNSVAIVFHKHFRGKRFVVRGLWFVDFIVVLLELEVS